MSAEARLDAARHGLHLRGAEPLRRACRQVIHGTPITPASALASMAPTSFCVSYWNRRPLGPYLDRLAPDGTLLLDNGAYNVWRESMRRQARGEPPIAVGPRYWQAYYDWAEPILRDVPQALAIIPDVIGGSEEDNRRLALDVPARLPLDRMVPVWHLGEGLAQLDWMAEGFGIIAFGSSGRFSSPCTQAWRERMAQAFDALEAACADPSAGRHRPQVHLLRGLAAMAGTPEFPVTSADSTNLARNHARASGSGTSVARFQGRLEACRFPDPRGPAWPDPALSPPTAAAPARPLQRPLFADA